jgi:hypothetical protein
MFRRRRYRDFVAQAPVHVVICVSPEICRSRHQEPDKMRVVAEMDGERLRAVPF